MTITSAPAQVDGRAEIAKKVGRHCLIRNFYFIYLLFIYILFPPSHGDGIPIYSILFSMIWSSCG